jgi:hypothetical protein
LDRNETIKILVAPVSTRNAEWPCHVSFIGIVSSSSAVSISSLCNGRMTSGEQVPCQRESFKDICVAEHFWSLAAKDRLRTIVKYDSSSAPPARSRNWLSVDRMKAVLRENDPEVELAPRCQILDRPGEIVRDRQRDRPRRIWFKSYYGIEAERVGRDRGLCASAILSPEGLLPARRRWRFCAMDESVCRGAPSAIVLCEPPRNAHGFNPDMLSGRPRGPDLAPQRGSATKRTVLSAG